MWERLLDIALRPQHIIDGSAIAASQPVGERDGWRHPGFTLLRLQVLLELCSISILDGL
jgi:hypothetical protein